MPTDFLISSINGPETSLALLAPSNKTDSTWLLSLIIFSYSALKGVRNSSKVSNRRFFASPQPIPSWYLVSKSEISASDAIAL